MDENVFKVLEGILKKIETKEENKKNVKNIFFTFNHLFPNYSSFFDSFYKNIYERNYFLLRKVIFNEWNELNSKNLNKNTKSLQNKLIKQIPQKYEELAHILENGFLNYCNLLSELLANIDKNNDELKDFLNLESLKIKEFHWPLGDVHFNSSATILITFIKNKNIIYKPKGDIFLKEYYEILDELIKTDFPFKEFYKAPNIIRKKDHSFVEYITWEPSNDSECKNYYFNLGIHTALCYTMNGQDLLQSNIISVNKYPSIIDVEAFYLPEIFINKKNAYCYNSFLRLEDSVLKTGVVPHWVSDLETQINLSGLSNFNIGSYELIYLDKYDNYLKKETKTIKRKIKNLPEYKEKKRLLNSRYENKLFENYIIGFKKTMIWVLKHKKTVEHVVFRNISGNKKGRAILRHTNIYEKLLEERVHPYYLKQKKSKFLLKNLFNNDGLINEVSFVPLIESFSLFNCEIPYFNYHINHLKIEYNGLCKDKFFQKTSNNNFKRKLCKLNYNDLKFQLSIIENSINIFYKNKPLNSGTSLSSKYFKNLKSRKFVDNENKICKKIVNKTCDRLLSYIDNPKSREFGLIDNSINMYGNWEYMVKPPGLYDGTDGIALNLIYASEYLGRKRLMKYAKVILEQNLLLIDKKMENESYTLNHFANPSIYYFPLSTLYLLYIYHCKNNKISRKLYKNYVDKILNFVNNNREAYSLEYLNGLSSLGVFLPSLPETKLKYDLLNYILKRQYCELRNINFEDNISFSHGVGGILYSSIKISKYLNEYEKLKNIRSLLLRYNNIIIEENHTNFTWCQGLMGKLIPTFSDINIDLKNKDKIQKLLMQNDEKIFDYDNCCLCHGIGGNLILFKNFAFKLGSSQMISKFNQTKINYLNAILKVTRKQSMEELNFGEPYAKILNFGLMLGLSGVSYSIIQLTNYDNNILYFD